MNGSVAFIQAFVAAALGASLACAQTSGGFSRPADKPVPRNDRNSQIMTSATTISREAQQTAARSSLLEALANAEE